MAIIYVYTCTCITNGERFILVFCYKDKSKEVIGLLWGKRFYLIYYQNDEAARIHLNLYNLHRNVYYSNFQKYRVSKVEKEHN